MNIEFLDAEMTHLLGSYMRWVVKIENNAFNSLNCLSFQLLKKNQCLRQSIVISAPSSLASFISPASLILRRVKAKVCDEIISVTIFLGTASVNPGSTVTNGREPRSCLGRVFNFKLGCIATPGSKCMVCIQPLLKLKTRPKARPVS
jgi:hypothetical protein